MVWIFIALMATSLLAGVGVKWAVDRVWPPPVHAPKHAPDPVPPARKVLEFDDTMDAIGDAYERGKQAQRWQDRTAGPAREPWISHIGGGEPGVAQPGGGWLSGPMLEPLPPVPIPDGWPPDGNGGRGAGDGG